jgi:hypothetical protein
MSFEDFQKIISLKIKKTLWAAGLHAFSIILILVLIELALGAAIYYKYVFLAESQAPQVTSPILKFDLNSYQQVMDKLSVPAQDIEPATP